MTTQDENKIIHNYKMDQIKIKKEKEQLEKKIKLKLQKEKKRKELKKWSNLTGENVKKITKINAKISFYTDLDCENGFGKITSTGDSLEYGIIANNLYPIGTKIYFEGYGTFTVLDKGSDGLSTYRNFDMFIPRNYGESDGEYYRRVNNKGIKQVNAYIIN